MIEDEELYGTFIEEGLHDWQILQQEKGSASVAIRGSYRIPAFPDRRKVIWSMPVVRVVREEDNVTLIHWKQAESVYDQTETRGKWEIVLTLPAGGLYRVESGLECREDIRGETPAIYRGDSRFHIGVGNIFVIAGQSNASGFAHDTAYDPVDLRVHVFRNRRTWELAAHPLNDSTQAYGNTSNEIGRCGFSPFLQFAKRYADMTGLPVGLVPTSMSGQSIVRWDDRVNGDLFYNMLNRIELSGGKPRAVLWYQGCTDAVAGEAKEYYGRFRHFVESLRKSLGYEIPVFTFQLNRILTGDGGISWGMIREAQRRAALEIPCTYVLPTLDCRLADIIHNSAPANLTLGERMARHCVYHLENGPFYEAPNIKSAVVLENDEIAVEFEHVSGRLVFQLSGAEESGFYAEDDAGKVGLSKIMQGPEGGMLRIIPERRTKGRVYLSFMQDADPMGVPVMDDESFLIPLAFYRFETTKKGGETWENI